MYRRALLVFLGGVVLSSAGCQTLAPGYTLSPIVRNGAEQYGDVMADFTNQALLENVLRARDFVPLNYNDLSAITGAFSMSGTAGFTLPFGPDRISGNMMGATGYKYSAAPSISGSASPVLTLGTLNTQGFILSMLQPVSTSYVLSKWDGHDHELLLRLFVKAIRFSDKGDRISAVPGAGCDIGAPRATYLNNPDDECEFLAFQSLVTELVSGEDQGGQIDLRSLMVLDPLGRPVPAGKSVTATIPPPAPGGGGAPKDPQYAVQYDATIFQTINGLADGQLHAGNASCPNDAKGAGFQSLCAATDKTAFVQFYKEYPAQVVLCLNPSLRPTKDPKDLARMNVVFHGHVIYPVAANAIDNDPAVKAAQAKLANAQASNAADKAQQLESAQQELDIATDDVMVPFATVHGANTIRKLSLASKPSAGSGSGPGGSAPAAGGSGGGSTGGGAGGGASPAAGASGQVTLALQPGRISAIVPGASCGSDQVVLDPETEKDFAESDQHFIHVEWRSVAEVVQYLGAIARHEDPAHPETVPDLAKIGTGTGKTILFSYQAGDRGPVAARYRSDDFSIPAYSQRDNTPLPTTSPAITNHSLEVLSMLNELVGVSKVSGSLPVSQPVQVLPP